MRLRYLAPTRLLPALAAVTVLGAVAAPVAFAGDGHLTRARWVSSSGVAPRVAPSPSASATPAAPPAASPVTPPSPEPTVPKPAQVTVPATDFFGWALLDRGTGRITGSANMATGSNSTESMIKVWIVADYLRRLDGQPDADTLSELSAAIVHSDDNAAEKYYRLGGTNPVVQRMITMCHLTGTTWYDGWWSRTEMTPQDAVRMGQCVADGTAAGATWTPWVLQQMRGVQGGVADQQETTGGGRWGIIDGVPASVAAGLAIKNGWTEIGADNDWHVNNLAISGDWILAVMVRYPIAKGLRYGADICSSVARQLIT